MKYYHFSTYTSFSSNKSYQDIYYRVLANNNFTIYRRTYTGCDANDWTWSMHDIDVLLENAFTRTSAWIFSVVFFGEGNYSKISKIITWEAYKWWTGCVCVCGHTMRECEEVKSGQSFQPILWAVIRLLWMSLRVTPLAGRQLLHRNLVEWQRNRFQPIILSLNSGRTSKNIFSVFLWRQFLIIFWHHFFPSVR